MFRHIVSRLAALLAGRRNGSVRGLSGWRNAALRPA